MIIALFEIFAGTVLYILSSFLSLINIVLPNQIETALQFFFNLPRYFNPLFPVDTLMSATLLYLTIWGLMYLIKMIIMGINMIPGVHIELPNHKINQYGGVGNKQYGPTRSEIEKHK